MDRSRDRDFETGFETEAQCRDGSAEGGDRMAETNENPAAIRDMVRKRFAGIARDPESESRFPVGRESALALGYAADELDAFPADCVARFAGVGCPLSLGPIPEGSTVLDVGAGSGLDALLAGRRVGPSGHVFGIDMTTEMVDAASGCGARLPMTHVEFQHGSAEDIPFGSCTVDVVLSNGVINLCPDKSRVLEEIHRVLRPGGSLYLADMFVEEGVDQETVEAVGTWSD